MFELKKGLLSTSVQAGVLCALAAALLVGCNEQHAPVEEVSPARLAAAAPETVEEADLPVVVVTATRLSKGKT